MMSIAQRIATLAREDPDVVARTATAEEKPRLWTIVNETWPNYDVYQTRTDREIPVVVLTPR